MQEQGRNKRQINLEAPNSCAAARRKANCPAPAIATDLPDTIGTELAPDQIAKTAANHPGLKGLVTFVRVASLSNADSAAIRQGSIKLIAVSSYFPNYKKFLNAPLLHLAVVPRFGSLVAHAQNPKTVREQFEQTYQLLTPENLAALP